MSVPFAALMCHAPIVLPEVAGAEAGRCRRTTRAMREVAARAVAHPADRLVLISPHSPRRRVGFSAWRGRLRGDLGDFRAPELRVDLPDAPEVADALGLPTVRADRLDHGAMVPLAFLDAAGWRGPTAVIALPWEEGGEAELGRALASLPGRTLVIASGDMSHRLEPGAPAGFHPDAPRFDAAFVAALRARRWAGLADLPWRAAAAEDVVATTLVAVAAAGAPRNDEVLSYEGPWGVGYTEAVFVDEAPPLYAVARSSIRALLAGEPYRAPPVGSPAAVFVTLRRADGELRGCVGTTAPTTGSVGEETARLAVASAVEDDRFRPVTREELDDLTVEVSVLEPPEPVSTLDRLDPSRYGLVVSHGGRRGVLLPDIEGVDTAEQQLAHCRRKAGLPPWVAVDMARFEVTKVCAPA